MWATFPMLREALDVIEAWGFSYKTVAFNWVKQNRNGTGIFMGLGNWTRSNSEICLLATKGKPKRISGSVSTNDNGVTQTVEARQGVALNAVVEIKPRVMLRPFRTFLEVEQPESEFLLRVDPDEGIGFFEADGGIWKLEAKKNIADYFLKNMGDLIDAGKVVVMQ